MGMTLLRGRDFVKADAGGKLSPVIINDAMARRFWHGQDPIGKRFGFSSDKSRSQLVVVGVVTTGKYHALSEDPRPFMYQFFESSPQATLVVRTEGDPRALLSSVRRAIQALDPKVVPLDLEAMRQYMAFAFFPTRTSGLLLGALGILALVLAVSGLYGVVSYTVSEGTREVGIRMALGAAQKDVLKRVLRQGMALTVMGIFFGVLISLAATRVLTSFLYGVRPNDPFTFAAVSMILTLVSLAACYLPARRATKVDPMVALKHE